VLAKFEELSAESDEAALAFCRALPASVGAAAARLARRRSAAEAALLGRRAAELSAPPTDGSLPETLTERKVYMV